MRRREFVSSFAAFFVSGHFSARAQATRPPFLIALLHAASKASTERFRSGFPERLRELGYVEGRDYLVEERYAQGVVTRLPVLADELVRIRPNVIVAVPTVAVLAARQATTEIPIISAAIADPEGLGLIESQARPGTNVTGVLAGVEELAGKQLALARELVPNAARIGLLANSLNPPSAHQQRGAEVAAAALSIKLVPVEVPSPDKLEEAFQLMLQAGAGAVFVIGDPMFLSERRRIAAVAMSVGLPTMYIFREHVEDGGLMSYGVDLRASWRQAADYVDKILKGARTADLPVELPTRFELVLNLNTAKRLGVTIAPALLARADEVIE
jgi:putative tryptophan/tyrosine transport system substrate-binding protein